MTLINGKAVTAVLLIAVLLVVLYCYVSQSYRVVLSFEEKSKATVDDSDELYSLMTERTKEFLSLLVEQVRDSSLELKSFLSSSVSEIKLTAMKRDENRQSSSIRSE